MTTLRQRLAWQAVSVGATGALLLAVRVMEPLFWYQKDKRNQYLPVAMDIGRRLRHGEFPAIDPDLGTSGNFSLDLQYGLYEPSHWLVDIALSHLDDLALAGFLWTALYLIIIAWGGTALTLRLGVAGAWAAAAGIAIATSGYLFFWLSPNWVPGMTSMAWIPWLWWAWAGSPGVRRCGAIAVLSYLVVAGGWPATWFVFAALALGFTVESVASRVRGSSSRDWAVPLGIRVLATVAGMLPAVLTVLPLAHASAYTIRTDKISNRNFLVANLADMVSFASPGLHGDLLTFQDQTTVTIPIFFVAWFALPVLWLVPWSSSLLRTRGVLTGAVACGLMLVATQAPSTLGPLRDPIRSLAGAQLFFVVTVAALACAGPLVVNRARVGGVVVSLLLMATLTWERDPSAASAASGVLAMTGVALAVMVLMVAVARGRLTLAGVVAAVGSLVLSALAFGLNDFADVDADVPARLTPGRLSLGAGDRPVFAIYPKSPLQAEQTWFADGVGRAFQRLSEQARIAPGYSSIRQRYFGDRFCVLVAQGDTCPAAAKRLFDTEEQTGTPWIDLLGYQTVVVAGREAQRDFARRAAPDWRQVDQGSAFDEYQRAEEPAVSGRVTGFIGNADVESVAQSARSQSYDVSSAQGATLIFRDLYWPGYQASLDGARVPVDALDETLVAVELPPGSDGRLTVTYQPLSATELVALPAAGVGVLGAAMLVAAGYRRTGSRQRRALPGGHRERDQDQPDEAERLKDPV